MVAAGRPRRVERLIVRGCARCNARIYLKESEWALFSVRPNGWAPSADPHTCSHLPVYTPQEMERACDEIGLALGSADEDDDIS
jgi:hypothetical protein